MAHDEVIADLQARIERLEQENRQLAAQVNRRALFKKVGAASVAVAGAAAAGQLLGATPAAADNGQPVLIGRSNSGTEPTEISAPASGRGALYVFNTSDSASRVGRAVGAVGKDIGIVGYGDKRAGVIGGFSTLASTNLAQIDRVGVGGIGAQDATGVAGISESGTGTSGTSQSGKGVVGTSNSSTGVDGYSFTGFGVAGNSTTHVGVYGLSDEAQGVYGRCFGPGAQDVGLGVHGVCGTETGLHLGTDLAYAGVLGDSQFGIGVAGVSTSAGGVVGHSQHARGGVFTGGAAAVRLTPSPAPNPPASGETGDLLVDSTGRLWFCKGGGSTATWVNLA